MVDQPPKEWEVSLAPCAILLFQRPSEEQPRTGGTLLLRARACATRTWQATTGLVTSYPDTVQTTAPGTPLPSFLVANVPAPAPMPVPWLRRAPKSSVR